MRLLNLAEIEALPDLEWIIDGVLPASGLVVLYGEPGSGKTFAALSMALTISQGQRWADRNTRGGEAIYIAAEGVLGLKKRIRAFVETYGSPEGNVHFIADPIVLHNADHRIQLLSAVRNAQLQPAVIVVDTLARVALGLDENSAKDMGALIEALDELKRSTGATILVIHHTGKAGNVERGSSAIRGAADLMISCESFENLAGKGVRLICTKVKDAEPFSAINLLFQTIQFDDGSSSLVLENTPTDLTGIEALHSDQIRDLLRGQFAKQGATHSELKKAFTGARFGSDSTFNRAWKTLKGTDKMQELKINGRSRWSAVLSESALPK